MQHLIFSLFSHRTERQWRDLAFCLSMLSYNERGIRKLQENFTCFHDKLAEEDVYQSFLTIVGKSKKFAKPEVKVNLNSSCQTLARSSDQQRENCSYRQLGIIRFAKANCRSQRITGNNNVLMYYQILKTDHKINI